MISIHVYDTTREGFDWLSLIPSSSSWRRHFTLSNHRPSSSFSDACSKNTTRVESSMSIADDPLPTKSLQVLLILLHNRRCCIYPCYHHYLIIPYTLLPVCYLFLDQYWIRKIKRSPMPSEKPSPCSPTRPYLWEAAVRAATSTGTGQRWMRR